VTSAPDEAVDTDRLRGERPRDEHADLYAELFGDPAVAATLWPDALGGPRTPAQASALLAADVLHWERFGYGPWAWFARDRFVARGGLERTDVGGPGGVEVLYAIRRDAWGLGYATEIALAAVQHARALGIPEVVGFTLTTNLASQLVLQKAGLRFEREVEHAGLPHWLGRLALR
jgi:RimJ/RimL family protein N-acetyltransferase